MILSFGVALGVSSAVFDHAFGYPGEPSTLPLLAFITIAFGVLLDTFIERSVLFPALVVDIGPRVWRSSALAHKQETRYRRGEADSARPTDERHPGRPTAVAASDTLGDST